MTWTTRQRSKIGPLAAIVAGDGPTLVLIHGVGLRAEAWDAQIDALAQSFRVVAVDMPGHGLSTALRSAQELSDFTQVLATTLTGPAVVIGHSFGAMIALDLAINRPEHVVGVAALNAIYRRAPDARAAVLARANSLDGITVADPKAPVDRWFGTSPSPERAACKDWLLSVDQAGYKDAYQVFAREDGPGDADLAALTCPALFMTGALEPNSTPEMSRTMAVLAPKGRAMVIKDAAHMMPMTHPDTVNAALTSFAGECFA